MTSYIDKHLIENPRRKVFVFTDHNNNLYCICLSCKLKYRNFINFNQIDKFFENIRLTGGKLK